MNYFVALIMVALLYLFCSSLDAMDYAAEKRRSVSNFETKKHQKLHLEGMYASEIEIEEENNRC